VGHAAPPGFIGGRNGSMIYHPSPISTEGVDVPKALHDLTERLAENTHDVWARLRLSQGWTYGPSRDDDAMTHPGLVPYAELPETEKAYDRETAMQTIKAILVLGYRILPPP
jgi:ryanodine receptor 2